MEVAADNSPPGYSGSDDLAVRGAAASSSDDVQMEVQEHEVKPSDSPSEGGASVAQGSDDGETVSTSETAMETEESSAPVGNNPGAADDNSGPETESVENTE